MVNRSNPKINPNRFDALDQLRGLLVALMALDHAVALCMGRSASEFWYRSQSVFSELVPFLSRATDHPSAAGFFLAMGMSMALFARVRTDRGATPTSLVVHFLYRGLTLIALQFLVVNFAWLIGEGRIGWSELGPAVLNGRQGIDPYFGVLYALGSAMMVCAVLLPAGNRVIAIAAVVALVAPYVYLGFIETPEQAWAWAGPLAVPGKWGTGYVLYTTFPWAGIGLAGILMGRWFLADRALFIRWLGVAAVACLAAFVLSRLVLAVSSGDRSLIALLYLKRYPPEFWFMVLVAGLNFGFLYVFDRAKPNWLLSILTVFGRNSLTFYTLHLFIYAAFATLFWRQASLLTSHFVWLAGLLMLYPICLYWPKFSIAKMFATRQQASRSP